MKPCLRSVVLVVFVSLVLTGCGTEAESTGGRTKHEEGEGPLSASVAPGFSALIAPKRSPWKASFGARVLCSSDGSRIEVEAVRYTKDPKALPTETWFRHIPRKAEREPRKMFAPFQAGLGDHLAQGVDREIGGRFTQDYPVITGRCEPVSMDRAMVELITDTEYTKRGGRISETLIDYRVGDEKYTLVARWELIGCGTATQKEYCDTPS